MNRSLSASLRKRGLLRRPKAIRELLHSRKLRYVDGNRIDLFQNGLDGTNAMLQTIRGAARHIHLETYIFRTDKTGQLFLDALTERASQGVEIRLLYDSFGSRGINQAKLQRLRDAGGEVIAFNPLLRPIKQYSPRRRDHRKILVVDGRTGFMGGLNIGNEYTALDANGQPHWHDTHLKIQGPIVRDLQAAFLESWSRAGAKSLPWHEFLRDVPPPCGSSRCALLSDGPTYQRRRMRDVLISALEGCEQSIDLASPYFAPGNKLMAALNRTKQKNPRVQLLLAGITDHVMLRRALRSTLPVLIDRGIEIYEFERGMMHAKVSVFDRRWAIVGTSNLDRQSFRHNYEINLIIEDPEIASELSEHFATQLQGAQRIDQKFLDDRSLWERFIDRIAALLVSLL